MMGNRFRGLARATATGARLSGPAISQILRALLRTAANLGLSMLKLDPLLVAIGRPKLMELVVHVRVLSTEDGPVIPAESHLADNGQAWGALNASINEARRIFMASANVVLKPESNGEMIEVITNPAPRQALDVGCNSRAYREGLTEAGRYFDARSHRVKGTWLGYRSSITVFVVDHMEGKHGCSLGPLADYVTVSRSAVVDTSQGHPSWTIAHEIGHACNLWHHGNSLMRPAQEGRTEHLNRWQQILFRASGHVASHRHEISATL